mmetsp:Transcript_30326/g.48283  ORF Transcript_30326/g.48283 Transcript_30326/m.48283 type:complete len:222 (-) Transcript_30326:369-1034(-)
MSPPFPPVAAPVASLISPPSPAAVVPVVRLIAPLVPAVAPFAVTKEICPLLVSDPAPDVKVNAPPVSPLVVPAVNAIAPPAPVSPEPTSSDIAPPAPPVAAPDDNVIAPTAAPAVLPVEIVTAPLTPVPVPAAVLITIGPLAPASYIPVFSARPFWPYASSVIPPPVADRVDVTPIVVPKISLVVVNVVLPRFTSTARVSNVAPPWVPTRVPSPSFISTLP